MKVTIIIPTYNEKGNVERLIKILEEDVIPKIKNHNINILVADDNSPDGTGSIVRNLMKKWKNLDINTGEKIGLGAAYVRAMTYAVEKLNADIMFEMDADFFHDPFKVPEFLKKIDQGYDLVIGTRYSGGGSIPKNWPLNRKMLSIVGNLIVRVVFTRFSIHDWTGGYRALKKEVFLKEKENLIPLKGYRFQVGFLYKAVQDGFRVAEIPFQATDRTMGRSKMARGETIVNTLQYVFYSRFIEIITGNFGKFLVVGGVGFMINASLYWFFVNNTNLSLAVSNQIAAQFAIFSNYNFNNLWTFKERRSSSVFNYFKKMAVFLFTSNIGVFFIQTGTIKLGDTLYGREYYFIYFLVGTFFLLIWNFTIYSKVIWRRKRQ